MVKDKQVKGLLKSMSSGKPLYQAAQKADICENTARKYLRTGRLPSELAKAHTWRTREDPFESVWPDIEELLINNPGLEAKAVFASLQRENPGKYSDGQLRTLQRRFRSWHCLHGPGKEVFFEQVHRPGQLGASDFTDISKLGITIQRIPFSHLIYHYVLTWSNWEHGTICFSESYESLCSGLQNALWHCGGVPREHRTDRMSAAVNNLNEKRSYTQNYKALLNHYNLKGQKTNPNSGNENGDIEQRHYRFKKALDQALMLRGSRDFNSRKDYEEFLEKLFTQINSGRVQRFKEELRHLRMLPSRRLPDYTEITDVRVSNGSTIIVQKNIYSVPSRLINTHVAIRIYPEHLEVYFESKLVQRMERLRGSSSHEINYRHIIDWLVRKPGAFANYRYRADLFPTSQFRIAYDLLKQQNPLNADKEYLRILKCAADESEELVNHALLKLTDTTAAFSSHSVKALVNWIQTSGVTPAFHIEVSEPELSHYDSLLENTEEVAL